MSQMSLHKVRIVYDSLKKEAHKQYELHDIDATISVIDELASITQLFNWMYRDDDLEDLLKKIAQDELISISRFQPKIRKNRIVFYDEIGSFSCLTLQYVRGLLGNNYEVFYIFESSTRTCSTKIISELNSHNVKYLILDSSSTNKIELIKKVYNDIQDWEPEKVILHTPAEGAFGVILWNAYWHIDRFRVVPGDHHFYLGYSCTDYYIEFRPFGYTVAVEQRNIESNKIFLNPYYPLCDNLSFNGFPINTKNKIVIFSAGNYYKVYDDNGFFFQMIEDLISLNNDVVFIFAGEGYSLPFKSFVKNKKLEEKVFLLGYRTDLNMCIFNSDIYLTTYPFTGGLTTQYAAANSKPILSYTTSDIMFNVIDDILGQNSGNVFTRFDYLEFLSYANKLVSNSQFRIVEGKRALDSLVKVPIFEKNLNNILNYKNLLSVKLVSINYDKIISMYLYIENNSIPRLKLYLLSKKYILNRRFFPMLFLDSFSSLVFVRYMLFVLKNKQRGSKVKFGK